MQDGKIHFVFIGFEFVQCFLLLGSKSFLGLKVSLSIVYPCWRIRPLVNTGDFDFEMSVAL